MSLTEAIKACWARALCHAWHVSSSSSFPLAIARKGYRQIQKEVVRARRVWKFSARNVMLSITLGSGAS